MAGDINSLNLLVLIIFIEQLFLIFNQMFSIQVFGRRDWWRVSGLYLNLGAQWLSGRVLDSRPRGRGLEPHRRHCFVSLSKTL